MWLYIMVSCKLLQVLVRPMYRWLGLYLIDVFMDVPGTQPNKQWHTYSGRYWIFLCLYKIHTSAKKELCKKDACSCAIQSHLKSPLFESVPLNLVAFKILALLLFHHIIIALQSVKINDFWRFRYRWKWSEFGFYHFV